MYFISWLVRSAVYQFPLVDVSADVLVVAYYKPFLLMRIVIIIRIFYHHRIDVSCFIAIIAQMTLSDRSLNMPLECRQLFLVG